MKDLIISLKQRNLSMFDNLIKKIKSPLELNKIYTYVLTLLLTGQLDQENFIFLLDNLIANRLHVSKIHLIKETIKVLRDRKFTLAYKFLTIAFIRCEIEHRVERFITVAQKRNSSNVYSTFKQYVWPSNHQPTIIYIKNKLRDLKKFIEAFTKFPTKFRFDIKFLKNELTNINGITKIKEKEIESMWISHNTCEIIHRLHLLIKQFGTFIVSEAKVDLVSYIEITEYDYVRLVNYYNQCINKVSDYIKQMFGLISLYVDLNLLYKIILAERDETIDISKYDFVLVQKPVKIVKTNTTIKSIDPYKLACIKMVYHNIITFNNKRPLIQYDRSNNLITYSPVQRLFLTDIDGHTDIIIIS